jgi:hypothetical protein
MAARAPRCKRCGGAVKYGDLHCGVKCRDAMKLLALEHEAALRAAGFVRHAKAPNVWLKDGVAVTRERMAKRGMDKTLVDHAAVVAQIAANAQRAAGAGKL